MAEEHLRMARPVVNAEMIVSMRAAMEDSAAVVVVAQTIWAAAAAAVSQVAEAPTGNPVQMVRHHTTALAAVAAHITVVLTR